MNGGETIELLKNVSEYAVIAEGRNFTLDLGGHTLTGYIDQYDATVTIKNGTVAGTIYLNGLESGQNGRLTIAADATVESDYAIILYQNGTDGQTGNGCTIDINGTINGMVWVMGNITSGDSVINVNDGAKISGDDVGIALNGYATVNVKEGATVTGTATGIEVRAGVLNVTGGTITGNGTATTVTPNGSGTTTSGAGIAIAQHTTGLDITVNISGGTITGNTALNAANPQNNTAGTISVAVTGGSFHGTEAAVNSDDERVDHFVSGGEFSIPVEPENVVEGKLCTTILTNEHGMYYIVDAITVTFNADNGSEPTTVKVPKGEPVAKPATDPTKEGYVFDGWYDGNNAYDFTKNVYEPLTLKAKWAENAYDVVYEWSDDNKTVTATATCTNNSEVEPIIVTVDTTAEITKPATCEEKGETTYTATFASAPFETQTKTVEDIEALGHKWTFVDFTWTETETGYTAVANFKCDNDAAHTKTVEATVTAETTAATCEEAGKTVYTAAATFEEKDYTDTKEAAIEALGHAYGEPEYVWTKTETGYTVIATVTCANDPTHVITENGAVTFATITPATCETEGEGLYAATFTNAAFTTQLKNDVIPALGHKYGEPTYVWNKTDDGFTVTATMICENDPRHVVTETVTAVYAVIEEPEAEKDGKGRYTATFENEAFETQTKDVVLPATGHEDVTVTFKDGETTVATQTVKYGEYAGKPADPEKAGWVFDGWYLGTEPFDFTTQVTENITLTAKWTEGVARIGTTLYRTLKDAFDAAQANDTIVLLKDVTIDSIAVDKKVTLDLDGHEVKSDKPDLFIVTGDLTITGSGRITGPENGAAFDGRVLISVDGGRLTVENGTLTATGAGADGMYGVYVLNGGTAIFGTADGNGPTIVSHFAAIGMNHMTKPATVTVYGGTYTANATPSNNEWWSYFCAPVYAVAAGSITIKGGTFNGYYGISDRYADVEQTVRIEGGEFNASSGTQVFADEVNGSNDAADRTIWAETNTLTIPEGYMWLPQTEGYVLVPAVKVTFDVDGEKTEVTIEKGTAVEKPEDPAKDGFVFAGWYLGEESYDFTKPVDENITLTAKWEENAYTVAYEWSDDNKTVTATATSTNNPAADPIVETVNTTAEITKPATCTYTATFTNALFTTQTKVAEDVDPLGHAYGEPVYVWSEDNKTVTATAVCANDPAHVITETVNTTSEVTKAATCEAKGETTYTATFANELFTEQTKTVEDVEALGHKWGEPTYVWADDNSTATATRVCENDPSHVETETVNTTSTVKTAAICEATGETVYTATFTNEAFTEQTKTVVTEARSRTKAL